MSTTVDRLVPEWATVVATRRETADTVTITVETDDDFAPGQFHMLTALGIGECPVSHSGHPRIGGVHEHTVRAVGAVSTALASLKPGDPIGVRGAYGIGWPMEEILGGNVVVVAGGIGLAPLRPVILAIESNPGAYERVMLFVGARTPRDIPFRSDLDRWDASSAIDTYVTVDIADHAWSGAVGVVTSLFDRALIPIDAVALICGPEVMMRFAAGDLIALGLAPERIYVSMERNMECGVGVCGHCQLGGSFICRDGPVMPWIVASELMKVPEL